MKIAVFGGSFDPLHIGHEKVINHLVDSFDLVYIVPVQNYQKKQGLLTIEERVYLLKKIYLNHDKIKVLDWNIWDSRITYTYFLLKKLKDNHINDDFFLVFGSDYQNISKWRNADQILKLSTPYKISRNNIADGIKINSPIVSSSEIRKQVHQNKNKINSIFLDYMINKKPLIVLDLDFTLFYPTIGKEKINLPTIKDFEDVKFFLRPHLNLFLDYIYKNFTVAVWSSSGKNYVNHVCSELFRNHPILFQWNSSKCSRVIENSMAFNHIKKLSKVSKKFKIPLEKILILDDSFDKCFHNYGNYLYISEYKGDLEDKELIRIMDILKIIKNEPNFRSFKKQTLPKNLWDQKHTFKIRRRKHEDF